MMGKIDLYLNRDDDVNMLRYGYMTLKRKIKKEWRFGVKNF